MTTINPAKVFGEENRRGSLRKGTLADVSILELSKGNFLFSDGNGCGGLKRNVCLEPRMVLKGGVEMPCSTPAIIFRPYMRPYTIRYDSRVLHSP